VSPPLDLDVLRSVAASVLELGGADEVEVVASGSITGLTRYANSGIVQNTARREVRVHVRVATGGRVASATTNQLDVKSLSAAGARARAAARTTPEDHAYPGMANPAEAGVADPLLRFDQATEAATPADRAATVAALIAAAEGASSAGIVETGSHAYAVLNSHGLERFDAFTRANATCLAEVDGATGWAERSLTALEALDPEELGRRAGRAAAAARAPVAADPGERTVVLAPPAVAGLLEYFAYTGFGAKEVIEGRSFLTRRAGQAVAAEMVTVADDVFHDASIGIAFDLEGCAKQRVAVIDRGIATGPVTDRRTARRLGLPNTGHSSGSGAWGPYAFNVVLYGGSGSLDDLVAGVDDGIFVTRFWYVNVLDRPTALLTGMTRDGTFSIRRGELAEPLHNLRFAQGVLEALSTCEGLSGTAECAVPEWGPLGSVVAPAARLGSFSFSASRGR
jgi:predicted Zn-dependent protease